MGATTTQGTGPGDSHKRLAYLSRDLPKLKIVETTTNPQDLITTEVTGGGGCDCDFNTQWELIYSRAVDGNDPDDGAPVPSGVNFDPLYEWAFGIYLEPLSPSMVFSFVPITTPLLLSVVNLYSFADFTGMQWSPDNGTTVFDFMFQSGTIAFLAFGAFPPSSMIFLDNNNSQILLNAGAIFTNFQNSGGFDAYFVIARRRIIA
jgi:hypothetical protein